MRKERKQKLLDKFQKKDSRAEHIWPMVVSGLGYKSGSVATYVRIKRHGVYFLVPVVKIIEGGLQMVMAAYERIHFDAFNVYKHFKIDLKTPNMEGSLGVVNTAYLDINQEDEKHE